MTKVSTNAGKHPYLRSDSDHLFNHIRINEPGIKFDHTFKPKVKATVDTEFKDKKGKKILFKDLILYEKEEYIVGYNSKEFFWNVVNCNNPKKAYKLREIAHLSILQRKGNKI